MRHTTNHKPLSTSALKSDKARRRPGPVAFHLAFALAVLLPLMLSGTTSTVVAEPSPTVLLPLVVRDGVAPPAPVARPVHYQTAVNTPLTASADEGVLAHDPHEDDLRAILISDVAHGTLTLNADGSFAYEPDAGFRGQDTFTYRAALGSVLSDPATVVLTVMPASLSSAPRITSGAIAFTKRVIGTEVQRTHVAYAADFNGDGHLDVLTTQYGEPEDGSGGMVLWLENDGSGGFTERVVDPGLQGAYPAHIADMNHDGRMDILIGGYDADTFAWYANDGAGAFTRIIIDARADGAHSLVPSDLDNDGDTDLVATNQDSHSVTWYENDGDNRFQLHVIDDTAIQAKRAEVADIDGDGDQDVVAASFKIHEIAWYENDGGQSFTKHVVSTKARGAYYVEVVDVDGDGDSDLFSASQRDNTIAWYENDGQGNFKARDIDTTALGARTVVAVDLDRDGDNDALAASVDDNTVAWHSNDGRGNFGKQVIDSAAAGAYAASAVDMDFDGDYDVLSASRDSGEIALHTQIRLHEAAVQKRGALLIDAGLLLTVSEQDAASALIYTLTAAPQQGALQLDGAPLAAGATFSQDAVNNGRVRYVHTARTKTADQFTFTVNGSGADGAQPAGGAFFISIK